MYVGVSPLFSPGTTTSTKNTDRNSSWLLWSNPLPLPSPVREKKGQMLFTLRVLAVIYIYPVLYTSSSCSPSCHQGKWVFLPLLCRWGEWGWQGQPQALVGPGSWTWLLLEHVGSPKHQQVIQLASVPLHWQTWDPSIHPSSCILWNLVQTFTSVVLPHSSHPGFWKGDGLRLQAASQAWGCKPRCVFWHLFCHAA